MSDFVAVVADYVVILPVQFSEFCALMVAVYGGFCRSRGGLCRDFARPIQRVLRFDGGGLWRILSQSWRFLS